MLLLISDTASCLGVFLYNGVKLHLLSIYNKSKVTSTELWFSFPLSIGQEDIQGLLPLPSLLPLVLLEQSGLQLTSKLQLQPDLGRSSHISVRKCY